MDTIDELDSMDACQQMYPTPSLDYNPNDIMDSLDSFDISEIGDYVMTLSKTQDFGQTWQCSY